MLKETVSKGNCLRNKNISKEFLGKEFISFMYLSIFCNKRAKRNNRVSLTKCMWDSCEKVTERKLEE